MLPIILGLASALSWGTGDFAGGLASRKVGPYRAVFFAEAIGLENLIIDPWPTPLSGYVQTNNIYLNPNSAALDQEACWNFAEFMLSKQSQNIFADPDMAGFIPSVLGIRLVDTLQMQAMNTFTGGAVFPINPEMRVYWDPVNNALLSVMEQGIEPAEALQSAHDEVAEALETIREE